MRFNPIFLSRPHIPADVFTSFLKAPREAECLHREDRLSYAVANSQDIIDDISLA